MLQAPRAALAVLQSQLLSSAALFFCLGVKTRPVLGSAPLPPQEYTYSESTFQGYSSSSFGRKMLQARAIND